MEIVIVDSAEAAGTVVADIFEHAVHSGARTLGLATGSSPLSVYRELARRHGYFVPPRAKLFGQRAEERHVRRVRQVNPEEHQGSRQKSVDSRQ